jgi:hypothetical protein
MGDLSDETGCLRILICNLFIFPAHSADRITEVLETENLQARWLAAAAGTRHLAPGEPLL